MKRFLSKSLLPNAVLLAVALIMLIPMLQIVNVALKSNAEFLANPISIVKKPQWSNFIEAWTSAEMSIYFFNSFIYTFFVAAGVCIVATLAAYPIARKHVKGSNFLYMLFLSALFLPAGLVPLLFIMKYLNLMNTYHGFILMKIGGGLSVAVFIFTAFIKGIPKELDEAAAIDGCGYLRYVLTILLPLMKPAIMTVGMLSAIGTWNDFISPYVFLIDKELRPLTSGLYMFMGEYTVNWPILASGILIIAAPLLIAFIFLQKFIVSGITAGSIKG
ncbi:carbohydrate ABC transporter permease [Fictibacillus fluitans]|uniref:Carbohydrate ABC transporter permease n=1 Tax=Fictibacillus fluitans TaxID=3058422 RepID=A0ABT8HWL4_9BACL|nr:carbohydrate ABC transporter permease [Fictibacillus sp. NE201]MDN4525178.1 carbohydrate ABC transporter permease [Fictibacillus sp. NE201]